MDSTLHSVYVHFDIYIYTLYTLLPLLLLSAKIAICDELGVCTIYIFFIYIHMYVYTHFGVFAFSHSERQ